MNLRRRSISMRVVFAFFVVMSAPYATAFAGTNGDGSDQPGRRPPNVLLIVPDQLRAQSLGCMGCSDIRTPNIDKLASEGVLFKNTFANTPVCCPARAILLTGKYAHKNGMKANDLRLRESETTIAEILAARGYRTGFIGKWHLDGGVRLPGFVPPGPRRQGFDYWAASECSHEHFKPRYFLDDPRPIVENRFETEVWTDRAIEFLRSTEDRPFFLVVAPGPPHDPYGAPEAYMKEYENLEPKLGPDYVPGIRGAGIKEIRAYYAAITAVDSAIGRLIGALAELDLAENTIVVVTSDHGDMLGSHGMRLKRKPYEESIRVPGIVRYPAKAKPGRVSRALWSHVDFAPTLLKLCGVDVPGDMQGADLSAEIAGSPALNGGSAVRGTPESVFFQIFLPFAGDGTPGAWRGVRTERHMYARTEKSSWLLYDLENDPYELKNLVDDPASTNIKERMDKILIDTMRRTGDSWAEDTDAPLEDEGRLYRFRTFYSIPEFLEWERTHPELAPKRK